MVQIPNDDYRRLLQQLLTAQAHPDNRAAQSVGEEAPESRGRTDAVKGE